VVATVPKASKISQFKFHASKISIRAWGGLRIYPVWNTTTALHRGQNLSKNPKKPEIPAGEDLEGESNSRLKKVTQKVDIFRKRNSKNL
jgi:hypothetical protein